MRLYIEEHPEAGKVVRLEKSNKDVLTIAQVKENLAEWEGIVFLLNSAFVEESGVSDLAEFIAGMVRLEKLIVGTKDMSAENVRNVIRAEFGSYINASEKEHQLLVDELALSRGIFAELRAVGRQDQVTKAEQRLRQKFEALEVKKRMNEEYNSILVSYISTTIIGRFAIWRAARAVQRQLAQGQT